MKNVSFKTIITPILLLILISCKEQSKSIKIEDKPIATYIDGKVKLVGDTSVANEFMINLCRFNYPLQQLEGIRYCNLLSNKNYFLEFGWKKSELLNIFYEDIFVTPGDTVTIDVTYNTQKEHIESFQAKGKNAGNYLYYFSLRDFKLELPSTKSFSDDFVAYKKAIQNYKAKRLEHFNNFTKTHEVSAAFIEYVKNDIEYQYWSALSDIVYHAPMAQKASKIDFLSDFKQFVMSPNNGTLSNKYYCMMLTNFVKLSLVEANAIPFSTDYFVKAKTFILKTFKGEKKDYLLYDLATQYAKKRGENHYSQEVLSHFNQMRKSIKSKEFSEAILKCDLDGRALYRLTQEVRDIKLGTLNGGSITLDSLIKRKKFLYLDFWANWCKPCIKEFKNIEETNLFLHSQNIDYILLNAHDGIHEKWKAYNQKLKIEQYESYNGYDLNAFSVLAQTFDITAIPKFILIDNKGEVATFNAPRPSDPKFKQKIMDLVK